MAEAKKFMGDGYVEETELRMGAEDFGYYSQLVPGCFFRLGTGNIKKGITSAYTLPHLILMKMQLKKEWL
jgi:hippurate hydrolase